MNWWRTLMHPPRELITPGARWSVLVVLVLALAVNALSATLSARAIHRAQQTTATITQLCQAGNEFRAEQRNLWEFVIHLSKPPPGQSRAQHAREITEFRAYMNRVFGPRDCQKVVKK